MNELYETEISDLRWWIYDILGNAGWIIWMICTCLLMKKGVSAYAVLTVIPVIFMIIGIAELISERIQKLDRILVKKRVWRGFGALTIAGILGIPIACYGITMKQPYGIWMLAGAVLCALFAWLCFKGYRKQNEGKE